MKVTRSLAISLALGLSAASYAQTNTKQNNRSTASETHSTSVEAAESHEQFEELKQMLLQQQKQINELRQELQETRQQSTQLRTVSEVPKQVNEDIVVLREQLNSTVSAVQEERKKMSAVENPEKIHYKGILLTPGGFIAAESVWRNHTQQNDLISSFNGIPYEGDPRTSLTEFRASARQSRLSLLAESHAGKAKLTGYWEADFLGAAPTANENQSSSFNLRERQLFASAALDNGWSFTAGQIWSLITLNKKGIEARGEWVPATIDAQYVSGYNFARLYSARISKSFLDKKGTFALAAENSAHLVTGSLPTNISGVPGGVGSAGAGSLGNGNNYTTAVMPDFVAKLAFDPGWGHYELKGVSRVFRDHVLNSGTNNKAVGGGIGFGAILPAVNGKINVIAQGMYGEGNSRYNDSGNADLYLRPDGALELVHSAAALVGTEVHPTKRFDWYTYLGAEYQQRSWGAQNGATYGYAPVTANNSKCFANESTFSCSTPFKNLNQVTSGFWYRFYKGNMGTVQYGMQYSYTQKIGWVQSSGLANEPVSAPKGDGHMVFTSFRYYIP